MNLVVPKFYRRITDSYKSLVLCYTVRVNENWVYI